MIYALRGGIHFLRNDRIYAIPDLQKSLAINPRNGAALLYIAKLHFREKAYTEARDACNSVIEIDKDGVFGEEAGALLAEIATEMMTATGSSDVIDIISTQ